MYNQTPKAPYLLKDPNDVVALVAAKPTGVKGVGPFGLQMACGFCDITEFMAVGTWTQNHGGGSPGNC